MRGSIVRNGKLFVLLLFVIMLCPPARAEEAAQVRIPVLAFGADCTAVLYDSEENLLQVLPLRVGETSAFAVHCVGLQRFTYTVRLLDQDTDTVKYDHTQYHIHVDLFYGSDDKIIYSITVDELGVLGQATEGKKEAILFENTVAVPTPTPVPYTYRFTFTKLWPGEYEDSIDWVLYKPDGTVAHKKFNKKIVSANEWYYEAWFPDDVDYYLIESVPDGYTVRYENVGKHAGETDRCYNGGKIINYKVPKTGDQTNLPLWLCCILLGLATVSAVVYTNKRKKAQQK